MERRKEKKEKDDRCGAPPQTPKQSPWSSASEKEIDSLTVWLIPTLGHPDDFTASVYLSVTDEQIGSLVACFYIISIFTTYPTCTG